MSHWNINKILARSEKVVQYIQLLVGWPESGPQASRGPQGEVGSLVLCYLTSITSARVSSGTAAFAPGGLVGDPVGHATEESRQRACLVDGGEDDGLEVD